MTPATWRSAVFSLNDYLQGLDAAGLKRATLGAELIDPVMHLIY